MERVVKFRVGEVSGDVSMESSVPVDALGIEFRVETEEQLRGLVRELGGIERFGTTGSITGSLLTLYRERDEGSEVPVDVHVWLGDELAATPRPTQPAAIQRLLDEAKAAEHA